MNITNDRLRMLVDVHAYTLALLTTGATVTPDDVDFAYEIDQSTVDAYGLDLEAAGDQIDRMDQRTWLNLLLSIPMLYGFDEGRWDGIRIAAGIAVDDPLERFIQGYCAELFSIMP